jgi:aspartate carbamoyltransferase catalytic subunit
VNRHLLSINDLSLQEALGILNTASELSKISDGPMKKLPTLRGRTVVNLFFEDSTRTRISFESAAKRLSADVINFSAKGSSVSKGESLKDTAQTLQAMGADAVVIRHGASGAAQRLADSGWISASVINAGDGTHEHPTQALLDAYTIRSKFPQFQDSFAGLKVGIVGDILHSRVARSNVLLLTKLGAKVTLVAPPTLIPVGISNWDVDISYNLDEVVKDVDVLMMLRVQSERMKDSFFPSEREYSRGYGLDLARLNALQEHAIVMHPGPMNRGLEISAESADSHRSVVLAQVSNGVLIRMAVLYQLLGGAALTGEVSA